jgi:hypothetical protein
MSNFLNKIPVSPITSLGSPSIPNDSTIGTNFSILQTGGYMEIYLLSGLTYTIPPSTTGVIEFSGNSIPIQFIKGTGAVFSPDVLILNSDNISSGRRKLGMLSYVYETNKIYQFNIDNYDTLWNNVTGATGPGGATVVISDYGTTVKNNSAAGIAFINAWTASTISGIGGYNDTNASWIVLSTGGTFTGGTVTGATIFTDGLTANTISATTYQNLPQDIFVTGGTYSNSIATFTNNTGGTFNVTGLTTPFTGGTVSGATIFTDNLPLLTSLYTGSQSLHDLGFKVNIGTVVWNQCKDILTDDPTKTRLVYSPNIVNGKFVHKTYKNPEKKAFITKPGIRTPMIVLNRGYGVGEYKFDYCLLTPDASSSAGYLIENHLICITHNNGGGGGDGGDESHTLAAFHRIIRSFKDPRTQEFISCYCGNSAINSTELNHMLPIYDDA